MLPGLQQGQEKMLKSDPLSSIFMEDDEVGCMYRGIKLPFRGMHCVFFISCA